MGKPTCGHCTLADSGQGHWLFHSDKKNDFSEFESCNPLSESVSVGVSIEEKEMRVIAGALALALTLTLFLYPERTKVAT